MMLNTHRNHKKRSLKILLSIILLCCITNFLYAVSTQQILSGADWFERDLGKGVVWRFYLFDDLFSSKQSISYIEIDLTHPDVSVEIPYLASSREKTSSMIPSQFPDSVAGINGTYFDTGTGGHRTYLRIDNADIPPGSSLFPPWGYEAALAMDVSGNVSIVKIPSGGWTDDKTHSDIIACGPVLIEGGTIPSAHLTAIGSHSTSRHPRSAAGITSTNHLILITVDGRTEMAAGMSCRELAEVMKELGCVNAFNLDGGGSTTLWGKGELYNGVLNYPSDNGQYDHQGERSCSNAIAIESTAAAPKAWDARLTENNFTKMMESDSQQTVSLVYENIGTETWSVSETLLVLSRPETRTSDLYHASWHSASQPALMSPEEVAPGETATFSFTLKSPVVSTTAVYSEHFMLKQDAVGRIGPADSEAWMKITVQPPVSPGETFMVETRSGGQNFGWYSDSGMANTSANCTAPGCAGNIGSRYGSTYQSVAGLKNATAAPEFPGDAWYRIYVAWAAGSSRRTPITYWINHDGGSEKFHVDQTLTANEWIPLGAAPYYFKTGKSGTVVMTNEDIDVSGSMNAAAYKFEYHDAPAVPDKEYVVKYLRDQDPKPVIDGTIAPGEWDAASPSASGYVLHDNPGTPASEDGSFRMLFDDSDLYIMFRMKNAWLPEYPTPSEPWDYYDLDGDKINFYLTPVGLNSQAFYRIMLSPNPGDGKCYTWSQASLIKTTDAATGTDWNAGGDAAYYYSDNVLTVEYRIPWSNFNYPEMNAATPPENNTVWGVQPCISNEISSENWEYVNWEPDNIPSYIFGEPFGSLRFIRNSRDGRSLFLY